MSYPHIARKQATAHANQLTSSVDVGKFGARIDAEHVTTQVLPTVPVV